MLKIKKIQKKRTRKKQKNHPKSNRNQEKKGGKEVLPTNPLELEKYECNKEIEKSKAAIEKYQ